MKSHCTKYVRMPQIYPANLSSDTVCYEISFSACECGALCLSTTTPKYASHSLWWQFSVIVFVTETHTLYIQHNYLIRICFGVGWTALALLLVFAACLQFLCISCAYEFSLFAFFLARKMFVVTFLLLVRWYCCWRLLLLLAVFGENIAAGPKVERQLQSKYERQKQYK